jgi:ATP-dependent protease ClpP protease subunit
MDDKHTITEDHDGAITVKEHGFRLHCMTIIGQVEGHYLLPENQKVTKYEHMLPALTEVEESDKIDGLLLLLNTVGGDVEAGLAIAEMIAGMSKPTVSLVLGGGHSIGMPLAVAAKRSFIVPSATMTLHPVRISGLVLGVPQSFDAMKKMQDRILSFVVSNSKAKEAPLRRLIMKTDEMATDIGTILSGEEAVEIGLIDEIGGLKEAIAALKGMTM